MRMITASTAHSTPWRRLHDGHADHHGGEHVGTPAQATIRDNSIRSAYVHVLADAFVSVLAITGLILAKLYGWVWMDPLAGIIGAVVIANWSVTLIRDTAGVLLDVCPDEVTRERVRRTIENDGDQVVDLHLWRLGPGHLAAVVAIATSKPRDATFYRGAAGLVSRVFLTSLSKSPGRTFLDPGADLQPSPFRERTGYPFGRSRNGLAPMKVSYPLTGALNGPPNGSILLWRMAYRPLLCADLY